MRNKNPNYQRDGWTKQRAKTHNALKLIAYCLLSFVLTTSLVPVHGIAYALGEDSPLAEQGEQNETSTPNKNEEGPSESNEGESSGEPSNPEAEGETPDGASDANEDDSQQEESPSNNEGQQNTPSQSDENPANKENQEAPQNKGENGGNKGTGKSDDSTKTKDGASAKKTTSNNAKQNSKDENEESKDEDKTSQEEETPRNVAGKTSFTYEYDSGTDKDGIIYSNAKVTAHVTVSTSNDEPLQEEDVAQYKLDDGAWTDMTWNASTSTFTAEVAVDEVGRHTITTQIKSGENHEYAIIGNVDGHRDVEIDQTAPELDSTWVLSNGAKELRSLQSGQELTTELDLSSGTVALKIQATNDDFASGKLTVTFCGEDTTVDFANGVAQTKAFSASDFLGEGGTSLNTATVTLSARDYAGNEATTTKQGIAVFAFNSDSAALNKITVDDLRCEAAEGVSQATDGSAHYDGAVQVAIDKNDLALIDSVTVTDNTEGDPLFTLSAGQTSGSANVESDGVHVVKAVVTTAQGASKELTKTFSIDRTRPVLSDAVLSNTSDAQCPDSENPVYFYNEDSMPTFAIKVANASTISDPAGQLTITVGDQTLEGTWSTSGEDLWTFTPTSSDRFFKDTKLTATVSVKNDFGYMPDPVEVPQVFVVDTDAPRITVTFSGPNIVPNNILEGFFKNAETGGIGIATIRVEDSAINKSSLTITSEAKKAPKPEEWSPITDDKGYEIAVPYVQQNGGVTFYFGEGNSKTLTVTAEDVAGHKSTYAYDAKVASTIKSKGRSLRGPNPTSDTTPVQWVGTTITDASDKELTPNTIDGYNVYGEGSVKVKVELEDANLDKENTTFYVNGEAVEGLSWEDNENKHVATLELTEPESQKADGQVLPFAVSVTANDLPGNETKTYDVANIVLDNTAPVLSISYSSNPTKKSPESADPSVDYYKVDSVVATITAIDPFFDKDTSVITPSGTFDSTLTWDGEDGVYTAEVTFGQTAFNTLNDLSVTAVDRVDSTSHSTTRTYGSEEDHSQKFVVDNVVPVVESVTFDAATARVGSTDNIDYFDALGTNVVTATITVKDNNFNADATISKIEAVNGTWNPDSWTDNNDGTYTTTVTYAQTPVDQTADFTITATDFSGSTAEGDQIKYKGWSSDKTNADLVSFVVDTDKPTVTVRLSRGPVDGKTNYKRGDQEGLDYYAKDLRATITVTDRNFDAQRSVIRDSQGHGQVSEWSHTKGQDTWTATVDYTEHAHKQYSCLEVSFQDKIRTAGGETVQSHDGTWSYATKTDKRLYGEDEQSKDGSGAVGFVVDANGPDIRAELSGPVTVLNGFARFFMQGTTIGILTVTVTDANLEEKDLSVDKLNKDETGEREAWVYKDEDDYDKYILNVPYVSDGRNLYFVGESVTSDNDKSFNFKIRATDIAGNPNEHVFDPKEIKDEIARSASADGFMVDVTSPKIGDFGLKDPAPSSCTYTTALYDAPVTVYDAESVTVRVPVTDVHLNKELSTVTVTQYTNGVLTGTSVYNKNRWEQVEGSSDKYYLYVPLEDEKTTDNIVYRIDVKAEDLNGEKNGGNKAAGKQLFGGTYIAVDATKPEINVSVDKNIARTVDDVDYYQADSVTVTVEAQDASFYENREDEYGYRDGVLTYSDNDGEHTSDKQLDWDEQKRCYKRSFTFGQNDYQVAYDLALSIKDCLGHGSSYGYGDNPRTSTKQINSKAVGASVFRVDNVTPKIDVVIDQPYVGTYEEIDYYATATAGKITATITVEDINFTYNASSSFKELSDNDSSFEVSNKGKLSAWKQPDTSKPIYVATITYEETAVDTKEYFKAVGDGICDLATNTTAYAYGDNNGQVTTKDSKDTSVNGTYLVLDTQKPTIQVVFDAAPVGKSATTNADYYDAKNLRATITVTDRNFDAQRSVIKDSQGHGQVSEWSHTKGQDTWTATVDYAEHAYKQYSDLKITYQDKVLTAAQQRKSTIAGHDDKWEYATHDRSGQGHSGAPKFVLDATAPAVKVKVNQKQQDLWGGLDFFATDVTLTITITDNNFDPTSTVTPTGTTFEDSGSWSQPNKNQPVYTRRVTYGESANINSWSDLKANVYDYVYSASGKKRNSHRTPYDYRRATANVTTEIDTTIAGEAKGFIVDKTAPELESVTIGHDPANTGGGIQFFNRATTLRMSLKDSNGLEKVSNADLGDHVYDIKEGENGFAKGDMRSSSPVSVSLVDRADGAGRSPSLYERNIQLKVTDVTGNYRIWTIDATGKILAVRTGFETASSNIPIDGKGGNHPTGLLRDTVAPRVSLSPKSLEGTFSNQTQTVTASVVEANFDYLQQFKGDEAVVHITKYEGNAGRGMSTYVIPASRFAGSGANWTHNEPFAEDGHYIVEAYFNDYATNPSNRDRIGEFTIDKTKPVINSIVWDPDHGNSYNGREYFKTTRTCTITITEHNWDSSLESNFIQTNGTVTGWSHSGDVHVVTIVFDADGDYWITGRITDRAGNVSEEIPRVEFTVDKTAPVLSIYNAAVESREDTLNNHAYNDVIEPAVEFIDTTTGVETFNAGDTSLWSVELTAANEADSEAKDGTPVAQLNEARSTEGQTNRLTVVYGDFTREVEFDDVYTLKATMTDIAGNPAKIEVSGQEISEQEGAAAVTFSVNRFGSNFVVLDADRYSQKDGFMSADDFQKQAVQVAEINVSGYEEQQNTEGSDQYWKTLEEKHDVDMTHGLDTSKLALQKLKLGDPAQEGYWVDEHAGGLAKGDSEKKYTPNDWQVYTYNVYGSNFTDDGDYLIAVSSNDVASNVNVSGEYYNHVQKKLDDAQVSFVFDHTKPRIEDVNIQSGKTYDQGKLTSLDDEAVTGVLSFAVSDNYQVDTVRVAVDGAEGAYAPDAKGIVNVPIEAKSFTDRTIDIVVTDKAGNEQPLKIEAARATNNIVELHWPVILVAVALAFVAGMFVARRRGAGGEKQSE